jgi:hypothetical protein
VKEVESVPARAGDRIDICSAACRLAATLSKALRDKLKK